MADLKVDIDVNTAPVDRAIRVMDNLEAEVRDVKRAFDKGLIAVERHDAEIRRLTKSQERLKIVTQGSAKDFRAFEKTVYGSGKAMRRNEIAMQQAGYQLQDFIVQIQAGTNPLIAFSQQGSQLAGFFAGPWGAAIGLGIAALGGLGTALLGARGKTKDLYDELKDLNDYLDENTERTSELIRMSFSGPLEQAREDAISVLEIFRKIDQEAARNKLNQGVLGIVNQIADVQDQMSEKRTEKSLFRTGRLQFVLPESARNELKKQEQAVARINELFSLAVKGPVEDLGFKLNEAFLTLERSGFLTTQLKEDFRELMETSGLQLEVERRLAEENKKKLDSEKKRIRAKKEGDKKAKAELSALVKARDLEKKRAENAQKVLTLKSLELTLLQAERAYGKDSHEYSKIAYDVEQSRYRLQLESGKYTKGEVRELLKKNGEILQLKYRIGQEEKASVDLIQEMNFQFSLVEDELKQIKAEQEALNKEAEKLGDHLGIGFERALEIILRAKKEATVGLDAFGGYGSFKYGGSTKVEPDKPKTTKKSDPLADLQKQIELEQTLIGKTQARQRIIQSLGVDFEKYGDKTINNLEAQINKTIELEEAEKKRQQTIEEARQQQEDLGNFIGDSFEDAMMSIVDGTKSVEDAFRIMAAEIVKELYRVLVVQQAVAAFKTAGKALGIPFFEEGAAFSNGRVTPFADGGVVASPTYFPMAGGNTGLMGEAGPEAIMPLKRGKDGKLGVQAEGGGTTIVNQTINVSTGVQQTVRTEIKSLMPQIAEGAKSAVLDAKRRGGAYGRTL